MPYVLQPRSDLLLLQRRYHSSGRVQVPALLQLEEVNALRNALLSSQEWKLIFNRGELLYEIDRQAVLAMDELMLSKLLLAAKNEGRTKFQYIYQNIRVPDEQRQCGTCVSELEFLSRFLNSEAFLAFARELVGDADIRYVDCQATWFGPGHFLGIHDDAVKGKDRVAAYVLNLSPEWTPSWGGQLQFLSSNGQVEEAFVPSFNVLNVLRVPQRHLVSSVAPDADPQTPRLSVTGWLRRRRP